MRRWLVVCLVSGLASSASAADVVKIGFHGLKPHCFVEEGTGKAKGAAVLLTSALWADAGYMVEWVGPLPFPRLVDMLKEGSLDGALPLVKNSDREEFAYFPEKPLLVTYPSFTVLKTNRLEAIDTIADVKGFRIGFLKGEDQTGFLANNASSLTIELLPGEDWISQSLKKLIAGRLDAVYDLNAWSVPFEAKLAGIFNKIKVIKVPGALGAQYIVISKKAPRAEELRQKLNASLQKKQFYYQDYVDKVLK